LTGREHILLYGAIKGISSSILSHIAESKLREVGLLKSDWDRMSKEYSGGMKRRLSLACATIGQPSLLFLDECSTGVDPVSRREIWKLVSNMVAGAGLDTKDRPSVILTTHNMDECEALCSRIGIMANGKLRCLGSAQHLKNKFGNGYQLELKYVVNTIFNHFYPTPPLLTDV
jgi:ABC-type multidrug transport system ATPase subunit